MTVGLVGDRETTPGGLLPYLLLGGVAQREHRPGELLGSQDAQHVGLVLARVDGSAQRAAIEPGVVARADGVEAKGYGAVEDGRKLDLLVAAQAGVGRATSGVFRDEVVHHL